VVLRPATVYGPGDATSGLMPRVVVAASYIAMGRAKMELLWEGSLKANTVHVYDVARAIVFAARKVDAGATFNLADAGNTDQAKLAAALGRLFGIETGFYGSVVSNLMRVRLRVACVAGRTRLSCVMGAAPALAPAAPHPSCPPLPCS